MVPLHLVEFMLEQMAAERDQMLHKSYNTIAKLSNKIGSLQAKVDEQKEKVKQSDRENLELRGTLNFLLQAKLNSDL